MTNEKAYIRYMEDDANSKAVTIEDIFIPEEQRRKGKGRKLIEEAIEYARDNNYNAVNLYAEPTDESITKDELLEFYRDQGFTSNSDCEELMSITI